jgi:hypothetical protein
LQCARYPMTKPHGPHRYNRIVVFSHCVIFPHTMHELHLVETQPLSHSWRENLKPLRYNSLQTITYHCADSVSGIRLQTILLIVQTVYQVSDCKPYFSLCRQCIRYQTADHTSHCANSVSGIRLQTAFHIHTYIIYIHVCKVLVCCLAQAGSHTAEDLFRTQFIRICGG